MIWKLKCIVHGLRWDSGVWVKAFRNGAKLELNMSKFLIEWHVLKHRAKVIKYYIR